MYSVIYWYSLLFQILKIWKTDLMLFFIPFYLSFFFGGGVFWLIFFNLRFSWFKQNNVQESFFVYCINILLSSEKKKHKISFFLCTPPPKKRKPTFTLFPLIRHTIDFHDTYLQMSTTVAHCCDMIWGRYQTNRIIKHVQVVLTIRTHI